MIAADYPFLDVFWTMLVIFLWIAWFIILFRVLMDLFRRHDVSGWGKTAWIIFVILLPFLGVFVYIITQGRHMAERDMKDAAGGAEPVRRLREDGRGLERPRRRDREGQGAPRRRLDHAGRVRRHQGEGARLVDTVR